MGRVCVTFSDTPRGRVAMSFATNLATKLGWALATALPWPEAEFRLMEAVGHKYPQRIPRAEEFIRNFGDPQIELREDAQSAEDFAQAGDIIVSDQSYTGPALHLNPRDEMTLEARGSGAIMLPIGAHKAGLYACFRALPLIKQLDMSVLMYHATWRDPRNPSSNPQSHLISEVRGALAKAMDLCRLARVRDVRTVFEFADGIPEGIMRTALREHCVLIVMARGRNTGGQGYGEQVRQLSPVPVLMCGRTPEDFS